MKPKSIVWWWLNVASSGTGNQQLLKAKMDSIKYEEIFGENVMRDKTEARASSYLQQDNGPKNNTTKAWSQSDSRVAVMATLESL